MAELKIKISADSSQAQAAIDAMKAKVIAAESAAAAASAAAKTAAAQESAAKLAAINSVSAAAELARAKEAGASADRINQLTQIAAKAKAVADATQSVGSDKLTQLKAASKAADDELAKLKTDAKALEQSVKSADLTKPFNGMAEKINAAKGSIAGLVGVFAIFGGASKAAMGFEDAMAKVELKANLGAEASKVMQDQLVAMSLQMPIAAKDLAAIAEAGASLGIEAPKLAEFTQLTAEMSVGFDMSAEAAGDAAGKISNIFSLSLENMRVVANTINALGDGSAAKEREIVDVLKRAGGAGQQFGLTANGVAALASTMLSLGESPEVAGTAINSLLSTLQAAPMQSKGAQEALKTLGFEATQLQKDIGTDAQGTLLKFFGTLNQLDDKSKTMALGAIFGTGGDTAAIAKMSGSIDVYAKSLGIAGTKTDGLKDAVSKMSGTASGELKKMGNSFDAIGIAAGQAILPVIKAMAQGVASVASFASAFVDAHPYISTTVAAIAAGAVGFGAISLAVSGAVAVIGGIIGPIAAVGGAVASFGSAAAAVVGPIIGIGAAGGTAAVGVGALGASFTALLLPIAAVVAAIGLATAAWMYFKDKSDTKDAQKSIEDLRKERAALAAEIASTPDASVIDAGAGVDVISQRQAQLDALDKRIADKSKTAQAGAAPADAAKPDLGQNAMNKAKPESQGNDISKAIMAGTDAAQAAYKARLSANAAALEAESRLRADASKRELEDMKRALDAESITAEEYFAKKLSAAQRDADDQIKVKQQEIAQKAAFKPASEADKETQRGELAKMRADLAIMKRDKLKAEEEIGREVIAARLKAAEEAESRTLGVMNRGLDQQIALAKRAQSLGLASLADVAAMEAQAAEKRVQIEIGAKERILAARIAANAPQDQIRQAEADVQTSKTRRTSDRADALNSITDRIKSQAAQTEEITLKINGKQAELDVIALSKDIADMRTRAEADAAVLKVQLESADPEEAAKIQRTIIDLEDATQAAIVAKNAELADKMKPGWQKMLDGWRDTTSLMKEGMDQLGQGIIKNGEDAFAEYAKTGKFSTKKMVDDMQDQIARLAYKSLMGQAQGAITSLFGGGQAAAPGQQPAQPQGGGPLGTLAGMLGMGSGAAAGAQGAAPGKQDPMAGAAGALTALTTAATGAEAQTGALTAVQQGLQVVQTVSTTTEQSTTVTATSAMTALALAAQSAALALSSVATSGAASGASGLMGMMAATGAVVPQAFARGGSFANSIVSNPTFFAFGRGGSQLGLMGEAGPEAIMPMSGGGIRAIDSSGAAVARLGVARDASGVLSVVLPPSTAPSAKDGSAPTAQAFARGGYFGGSSSFVHRFATGGVIASTPQGTGSAAQSAPVINQTISIQGGTGSSADMAGMLQRLKAETMAAVAEAIRRGNKSFSPS